MVKVLSFSITFLVGTLFIAKAQNPSTADFRDVRVRSAWFEKDGWRLSYPVIQLGTDEQIALFFDVLDRNSGSMEYVVTHCDRDWNPSDLFPSDYISGLEQNRIYDYNTSFNTTVPYTHYSLRLPNEDISFRISGNYTVTVFPAGDPASPVLRRRFFVHEKSTSSAVLFRQPMKPGTTETHQQPEITVGISRLPVTDPYRQVTVTIMQNGRWDRMIGNILPDFVHPGKLEFNSLSDHTLMPGGNEFRFIDIRSVKEPRQNVRIVEYNGGRYHAFVLPDDDRQFRQYFFEEDLNGKYWIASEESPVPSTEADYMYVYFTLRLPREIEKGSVYFTGAFTDWAFGPENRMRWNQSRGQYEGMIMLKEGWYNYEYAFIPDRAERPDPFLLEGGHWQTENDYLILTYFRDPAVRYDRLTEAAVWNTRGLR